MKKLDQNSEQQPKRRRKIWIPIVAAAVLVSLLLGTFIAVRIFDDNAPIYTGMTASSEIISKKSDKKMALTAQQCGLVDLGASNAYEISALGESGGELPDIGQSPVLLESGDGDEGADAEPKLPEISEEKKRGFVQMFKDLYAWFMNDSLDVTYAPNSLQYATEGEALYVTVHINNPEKFEIVSFTLNGEKYSSYMFEDGSDMENLVLMVEEEAAAGIHEYTIDAIKYIDGSVIKDVRMAGDQTVDVGVRPAGIVGDVVSATVSNLNVQTSALTFDVSINDSLGVLERSGGKVWAALYEHDVMWSKDVVYVDVKGTTSVRFDGLMNNHVYTLKILSLHDDLTGDGVAEHVIFSEAIRPAAYMSFVKKSLDYDRISFDIVWNDELENKKLNLLTLTQVGTSTVRELDVDTREITGLIANTEYLLTASFTVGEETVHAQYNFKTFSTTTKDGITYKLQASDMTARVTAVDKSITSANNIGVEGYTVVGFIEKVFKGTEITSVVIPNGVTEISAELFRECSKLESITIPSNVTSIGEMAFAGCTGLTVVTIETGVTSIGNNAFVDCLRLESITIPSSVTSIGEGAFQRCTGLTSLTFGGATSIGDYAFRGCTGLESVTITDSITSIGVGAFSDCTSLMSITIPDSITSIGVGAFSGCTSLESITLPFVGAIKNGAQNTHFGYIFGASSYNNNKNCVPASLKTVVITGGTSIDSSAFRDCTSLTSVTIPNSVTSIGSYAFYGCSGLTSITIPDGITKIGDSVFRGCSKLESIIIPDGVTSIDKWSFSASGLTSITIPDSIISIGNYAFQNCAKLTTINYRGTQEQWNAITKGTDWDYGAGSYTINYNYTGE